ncbi:serine/threonine-protein phosphatase Pgam5, mitochondrial-like isoform X2 [Macrosteles quadrilineatus]|uniref:serine/threonine-protein phosphatase Pgam5, mitochondrial-like isoform X2 n=1 Tax=Macrosteles quadrilineatus TaxID=74068 RepID=UPI0023E129A0|nr:serine/threonine-protein phosphatase Pgam5, mitochondrial-like isoform X2 [Macrosteles quadrilineatus]
MTVLKKVLATGISACGGGLVLYSLYNQNLEKFKVNASWTTNYTPQVPWDFNWDRRNPESLVKPCKGKEDEARYNAEIANATPTAKRHIILIRHGQYNLDGKSDVEKFLTPIGKEQAAMTGKRLKELGHNYTHLTVSTMTRAKETASIIQGFLPSSVKVTHCSMLEEGAPIPPEPPVGDWRPEPHFFQDGARIEAAFREHIHRASPKQKEDSYEVIVCHGNVIRFFLCRVLQFPADAWLRISLRHASLSILTILPSGRVVLRSVGDTGHFPPQLLTST